MLDASPSRGNVPVILYPEAEVGNLSLDTFTYLDEIISFNGPNFPVVLRYKSELKIAMDANTVFNSQQELNQHR